MKYLLDANMVIAVLNDRDSRPARRLRKCKPSDVAISAIVAHELYYGAFKSARREQNVALVEKLRFPIIEFDAEDAREAGELRAWLTSRGTPIGPYDVLIGAQARARKMVLVTRNIREFRRVPGLKIEDWS
ncbi:MAG: type II toxin-antitoxin system VapC family toxin [Verrucomicrobia bacterium]|nr:type II toxin-antitoxin system VapC family toxin [Verrucomicrobiota bacterium]